MFGKKKKNTCDPGWYFLKGIILIILGLLLWRGFLSLDLIIAVILVLAGIKFLLLPYCCK